MQQIADKMNFQDPVQKYAECHSWDMSNSNATKYHEIKVGILDKYLFQGKCPYLWNFGRVNFKIRPQFLGNKCCPLWLEMWSCLAMYRIGIHGSSTVLFSMVLHYLIAHLFNSFVPSRSMIRLAHGIYIVINHELILCTDVVWWVRSVVRIWGFKTYFYERTTKGSLKMTLCVMFVRPTFFLTIFLMLSLLVQFCLDGMIAWVRCYSLPVSKIIESFY